MIQDGFDVVDFGEEGLGEAFVEVLDWEWAVSQVDRRDSMIAERDVPL